MDIFLSSHDIYGHITQPYLIQCINTEVVGYASVSLLWKWSFVSVHIALM